MTVVVTGGSRGIGAAAVELFAAKGYRVFFLYEKDSRTAQMVSEKTGAAALQCDVSNAEAVEMAFSQIGDVDILVNNAGISYYGLMCQMSETAWERIFDVNVKSIFHCVRAVMPAFLKRQKGCIVNVASMWGEVGASCEAAYSASKGAVIALTKALAKELGPSGIRVNAVSPGVILTDMCAGLEPEVLQAMAQDTPLERNGTPMDVAKAIVYLAEADFVTGHIFSVNGGYVM